MSTTEKSPFIIREKKRTVYDVHDLWCLFTQHKRWFDLSFILCLCCAATYIYFARPAYSGTAKTASSNDENRECSTIRLCSGNRRRSVNEHRTQPAQENAYIDCDYRD